MSRCDLSGLDGGPWRILCRSWHDAETVAAALPGAVLPRPTAAQRHAYAVARWALRPGDVALACRALPLVYMQGLDWSARYPWHTIAGPVATACAALVRGDAGRAALLIGADDAMVDLLYRAFGGGDDATEAADEILHGSIPVASDGDAPFTVGTIHGAKGLEWDRVAVVDWPYRHTERCVAFVAATRARVECRIVRPVAKSCRLAA